MSGCQACNVGVDDQSETAQNDVMMTWAISSVWANQESAAAWHDKAVWDHLGISGYHVSGGQRFTVFQSANATHGDSTLTDAFSRVNL